MSDPLASPEGRPQAKMSFGMQLASTLACIGILAGVMAGIEAVGVSQRAHAALAAPPLAIAAAVTAPPEADVVAGQDFVSATPTPEEMRMAAIGEVWDRFDRLHGGTFRTAAMLKAHLLLANQQADHLPTDEAEKIRRFNAKEFRERLPALIILGEPGRAEGHDFRTIVPSIDDTRCPVLAAAWQKDGTTLELSALGFWRMRCGAKDWRLGGQ